MIPTKAYAAQSATEPLKPFSIERREPRDHDVFIDIKYCGVCHSDIHVARNEWGGTVYPVVPGHEIIGIISKVGPKVARFKVGDTVGVGCLVGSCHSCNACKNNEEQYCQQLAWTYDSPDGDMRTYGGYSTQITVDEKFLFTIPPQLALDRVAPLLCAGITTYSPLKQWKAGPGKKVGIVGLGGLGHMAVKLAKAMGAEVSVLSRGNKKQDAALKLGADKFYASDDPTKLESLAGYFDIIIDTVSIKHDINKLLNTLNVGGVLVLVGIPPEDIQFSAMLLISKRRIIAGSLIGGIEGTQEMLDFCAQHNIHADIELIPMRSINEAYERMLKSDVHYRFVIDCASLN